jgi:hypothetical protein
MACGGVFLFSFWVLSGSSGHTSFVVWMNKPDLGTRHSASAGLPGLSPCQVYGFFHPSFTHRSLFCLSSSERWVSTFAPPGLLSRFACWLQSAFSRTVGVQFASVCLPNSGCPVCHSGCPVCSFLEFSWRNFPGHPPNFLQHASEDAVSMVQSERKKCF